MPTSARVVQRPRVIRSTRGSFSLELIELTIYRRSSFNYEYRILVKWTLSVKLQLRLRTPNQLIAPRRKHPHMDGARRIESMFLSRRKCTLGLGRKDCISLWVFICCATMFSVSHRILFMARWMIVVIVVVLRKATCAYVHVPNMPLRLYFVLCSNLPLDAAIGATFFCISQRTSCRQEPCMPWNYKTSAPLLNQHLRALPLRDMYNTAESSTGKPRGNAKSSDGRSESPYQPVASTDFSTSRSSSP